MFKKRKKYLYQQILQADTRACQVRTNSGKILYTNAKGTLYFGLHDDPFQFIKHTKSKNELQELEQSYRNHIPTQQIIQQEDKTYEIQLSLLDGGMLLTLTDRTIAEQTYQTLEQQLDVVSEMIRNLVIPVFLMDKSRVILYANPTFLTELNYDLPQLIGKKISEIFNSDQPLGWQLTPIHAGSESLIIGTKKIITNLMREKSNETLPVPNILIDIKKHKIVGVNAAATSVLKRSIEELLDMNFIDLWDTNSTEMVQNLYQNNHDISIEVSQIQDLDKKTFRILWDQDNDYINCFLFDITPRKKLEQQLIQDQKMQAIGQLTGGIAHDFNNILTAIIGFADLLLNKHPVGDSSFSDIMQIKGNAQKAASLVGQLLTFTRKTPIQHKLISVHDAFVDITPLLQRSVAPLCTCQMDIKRNLGCIRLDPNQLTQIMLNLAINAKDAMKTGGKFQVTVTHEQFKKVKTFSNGSLPVGDYIKIVANDTGSGIPTEYRQHIFDPFFTTKEKTEASGTGLGLSTVYGIINSVGGHIDVDSEVGVGTTFTIYLPRFNPEKTESIPQTNNLDQVFFPQQSGTIILADDEDGIRLVVKRALSIKGFNVVECKDAHQALQAIQDNRKAKLLITDMVMPGMDGEHLIQAAQQLNPQIKAILMSGYSAQFEKHTGDLPLPFTFVSKPFVLGDLLNVIHKLLSN